MATDTSLLYFPSRSVPLLLSSEEIYFFIIIEHFSQSKSSDYDCGSLNDFKFSDVSMEGNGRSRPVPQTNVLFTFSLVVNNKGVKEVVLHSTLGMSPIDLWTPFP